MKLLLWTKADPASERVARRIADELHERHGEPERVGPATALFPAVDAALHEVDGSLLAADFADRAFAEGTGKRVDRTLFLSRHSAASGTPSFTAHPIGNLGPKADFGGRPRELPPADAEGLTSLVRGLESAARGTGVPVTLESTHHGPRMETPSTFVEVGSTEKQWHDEQACSVVARAVVERFLDRLDGAAGPPALGIGGGHYHPLQTDAALRARACIGPLLPRYALGDLDDQTLEAAVRQSAARAYLPDPRQADAPTFERLCARLESLGLARLEPRL